MDACIHCYKCVEACGELEAIDFSQQDKVVWEDIGAIIVATGFNHFDPSPMTEYGYGRYPNVITAMEMERLNNSAGPTAGNLIRPSDGQNPKAAGDHQLRRFARQALQPVVLQLLLHVRHQECRAAETDDPGYGPHHLLHGHPHALARATRNSTTAPARWASASSRGGRA